MAERTSIIIARTLFMNVSTIFLILENYQEFRVPLYAYPAQVYYRGKYKNICTVWLGSFEETLELNYFETYKIRY